MCIGLGPKPETASLDSSFIERFASPQGLKGARVGHRGGMAEAMP